MRPLTLERGIKWTLAVAALILLGLQFSSLYVTPIHDSYLWWGDESWLMNEYREQMTSGAFRHPLAYGSSLWVGNPFPFTSMWITSSAYGLASMIATADQIDVGRTLTAILAIILIVYLWRAGRSLALSGLALAIGIALLISARTFFLTSHSARYDVITALAVLTFMSLLIQDVGSKGGRSTLTLGALWGASLLVSVHVPILLALPLCYYLVAQRTGVRDLLRFMAGTAAAVGLLYLVHVLTQPGLAGETNLSENLSTIPVLRPFSWSVQSSNLVQKWELIVSYAPQILLMLLALFEGLRCKALARSSKQILILLALPMLGWLLFQPTGPSSYLIHFLPSLVLAAAISVETMLVGNWQRIVLGTIAAISLGLGARDAIRAHDIGTTLTQSNREALRQATRLTSGEPIVALNPAQSFIPGAASTHFIELPHASAERLSGEGYLLTYNSASLPNFMWEVGPLREEVTSPELMLTGRYLDVGRSYFTPLDSKLDTLFLQQVDLTALYKRHID